jgi:hypothetical protein
LSKPPKAIAEGIQWFPSKDSNFMQDLTLAPDWGTGQQVHLYFAIKDTGKGLSADEKTRLFHRFSQASPRTHVSNPLRPFSPLCSLTCCRYNMVDPVWVYLSRESSRNFKEGRLASSPVKTSEVCSFNI